MTGTISKATMTSTIQAKAVLSLLKTLEERLQRDRTNALGEIEQDDDVDWRKEEDDLKNVLLSLEALVGAKLLDKALGIVAARDSVVEFRAPSGRSAFRVRGDGGREYKVLAVGYCSCYNFLQERTGSSSPLCKHILGVYLAKAQQTVKVANVSDEDWGRIAWEV